MNAQELIKSIEKTTSKWTKQKRREERQASARSNRRCAMASSWRITLKEAVFDELPEAYKQAAGSLNAANARQIYYCVRPGVVGVCEKPLDYNYFCVLLDEFVADHATTTADWNVCYDARGTFLLPHDNNPVPMSTIEAKKFEPPDWHFGAVLFIEKEGFTPIIQAADMPRRWDVAIMAGKGYSTEAARSIIDKCVGANSNCMILVSHDFDAPGMGIAGTLNKSLRRRFRYENDVQVIDCGLRLKDVTRWNLESEDCPVPRQYRSTLRGYGCNKEEIEFLKSGRRVELNALGSDEFVAFLESKLKEHGVSKVIPNEEKLASEYERIARLEFTDRSVADKRRQLERVIERLERRAGERFDKLELDGGDLRARVLDTFEETPTERWTDALESIAHADVDDLD